MLGLLKLVNEINNGMDLCEVAQTCWLRKLSLGWDGILHPLQYLC